MVDRIFGGKPMGPIDPVKSVREQEKARAQGSGEGKDRVEFSTVLQEVNKAKGGDPAQDVERARKVAALKAKVADGTYRPDPQKIAEGLIKAMREEK